MKKEKQPSGLKGPLNAYAKYLGLAFQMGVLIAAGAWGGKWADARWGFEKPAMVVVGTLLGLAVGLYLFLQAIKEDDKP